MTLTEAGYWTKRFSVLFGGGFVLIIAIFSLYISWINNVNITEEILAPDFACTQFAEEFASEKIVIPSLKLATGSEELIEIDTPTGKLDELPLIANVYRYDNPGPSLNAQNQAKDIAKKLGFDPELVQRRGTIEYYWPEDSTGRSLSIDASSMNFKLKTNFQNTDAFPEERILPTDAEAMTIASSFIRAQGWLLDDYAQKEPITTLIDVGPDGSLSMAKSRAEAELIRVDFYRAKPFLTVRGDIQNAQQIKDQLEQSFLGYESETSTVNLGQTRIDVYNFLAEVVHQDTQKSNISVYVGPEYKRDKQFSASQDIYSIDYTGWVLESDACGTYPLLSATTVANTIVSGEASLVYLNEKNGDTVAPYQPRQVSKLSVKQVQLAYIDFEESTNYLQPVYIVIGEASLESGISGRFYYYIPAIDYENIQDAIPNDNTLAP